MDTGAKLGRISTGDWHIIGTRDASLYCRFWEIESPRATLLIVHGVGEHSGRYDYVARHFCSLGFNCYAVDHRGHGKSEGPRWNVEKFDYFVEDLHNFVRSVKGENPELAKNCFMLGHSLGGEIALKYNIVHPGEMRALVVSGPSVGLVGYSTGKLKFLVFVLRALSAIAPGVKMAPPIDPLALNHEKANVDAYANDPLVCHDGIKARMALAIGSNALWLNKNAPLLKTPCLVLQGSDDALIDPKSVGEFFRKIGSADKKFIKYGSFYHEILNEPNAFEGGKGRVLKNIDDWILPRI
ncbi:MAG: lysophospholipase [Candidatus Thermoplasmatota archaeon]|nr:lysophospholipase [Candidatus Thermoplasmatota archaeon]